MTTTTVIGDGSRFGYGLCSGNMLWSYLHMHAGGQLGTMKVNGKPVCESHPIVGTGTEVGNEKGFLVGVTTCIDVRLSGKEPVRLNKGDVVELTGLYDVDPASTRYAPRPGGKVGGAMGLFFSLMECDHGTWGEAYVCRNSTCVGVPRHKAKTTDTFEQCSAKCGSGDEEEVDDMIPIADYMEYHELKKAQEPAIPAVESPKIGKVDVQWRDCSAADAPMKMFNMEPKTMGIGMFQKLTGSGTLDRVIDEANVTIRMTAAAAGLTLMDYGGNIKEKHAMWTLLDQIHLWWIPPKMPMKAGGNDFSVELFVDPVVPMNLAYTTTTVLLHGKDSLSDVIACIEVATVGQGKEIQV